MSACFQAVSAAALYGATDCDSTGILFSLYYSSIVVDSCDDEIDVVFYNSTDTLDQTIYCSYYSSSSNDSYSCLEEYVGCDSPPDAPTYGSSFEARCTCFYEYLQPRQTVRRSPFQVPWMTVVLEIIV